MTASGSVRQLHDDGRVVAGALALALLAVDRRARDPRRRARVSRARSRCACRAAWGSAAAGSPSRCRRPGPGVCGRTTSTNPASRKALEGGALAGRDVASCRGSTPSPRRRRPAARCSSRRTAPPGCRRRPTALARSRSRRQPVELVDHVRVVEGAAVGHVERPHPDAAARSPRSPAPRRPAARPSRDRRRSRPARRRGRPGRAIATPFHWLSAVVGDLVARAPRTGRRGTGRRVALVSWMASTSTSVRGQPGLDAVDAGADGVDVPGGDAHRRHPTHGYAPPGRRSRHTVPPP